MPVRLSPGQLVAAAMGLFGIGLVVAAFVGAGSVLRLTFGVILVMAALITAGLQLLNSHGAPTRPGEEA